MRNMILSPKEVAKRLGISYDTVLRLIRAESLPKRDLSAGHGKPRYRILESEVDLFLSGRLEHPEPRRRRRRRKPVRDFFAGRV